MININILGLKKEDVRQKKIISTKDFFKNLKLEFDDDFEIIFICINEINTNDIIIDKTQVMDDNIISVSFSNSISLNINTNSSVKQYSYEFFICHSFLYSKELRDFNVYPISLNTKIINNEIYLYLTYVFTDLYEDVILKPNINNYKSENASSFSYIDVSKEFI